MPSMSIIIRRLAHTWYWHLMVMELRLRSISEDELEAVRRDPAQPALELALALGKGL